MTNPLHKGRVLNKYPVSAAEAEARELRKIELEHARANASVVVDEDGAKWVVLRLPDGYGFDIPFEEDEP